MQGWRRTGLFLAHLHAGLIEIGLAIVYKFFWCDPSPWTHLSWPWPLVTLSHWPRAAAPTVPHTHTHTWTDIHTGAVGLNSEQTFSALLISIFISLMFAGSFQSPFFPLLVLAISSTQPHSVVSVSPVSRIWCWNWVRGSQGCWLVSQSWQRSDLLLFGLICCLCLGEHKKRHRQKTTITANETVGWLSWDKKKAADFILLV